MQAAQQSLPAVYSCCIFTFLVKLLTMPTINFQDPLKHNIEPCFLHQECRDKDYDVCCFCHLGEDEHGPPNELFYRTCYFCGELNTNCIEHNYVCKECRTSY